MATTTAKDTATKEEYLQLHRWMCMAKALDDRMHILVKQGRAPFVGSSRGHEGIQVASTAALTSEDWLVPHYRGLANAIVRGLTMKEWMLAVFAKAGDPLSAGRNIPGGCYSYHQLHLAPGSQVVASWNPKAAGVAYAAKVWRINAHTSEDNHLKYRTKEEIGEAASHDPITRFEAWLVERGWITAESAAEVQAALDKEASDAADWAEQQPDPRPEDALKN